MRTCMRACVHKHMHPDGRAEGRRGESCETCCTNLATKALAILPPRPWWRLLNRMSRLIGPSVLPLVSLPEAKYARRAVRNTHFSSVLPWARIECKFSMKIVKCTLAHIFSPALLLLRVRKLRNVSCAFATRTVLASYANFLPPERITLALFFSISVLSETFTQFGRRALPTVSIFASFGLPATQTSEGTSRAKCKKKREVTK